VLHDAVQRGLALRVTPTGSKSWSVLYRHRGRLRWLTLGSVDDIGLADARERARKHPNRASEGFDPASEKKSDKQAETMADLAAEFIERYSKPRKRSWKKDQWLLESKVLPKWRYKAVKDVTRRDVKLLVEGVAAKGAPILANRLCALLSKVFKFAIDDEIISASPAMAITRPGTEKSRDRVLTDDEIRTCWQEFSALVPAMAAYYKLRLITAQRVIEVASMKWSDLDLDGGWWEIPAANAENKLSHRVSLSSTAVALIRAMPAADVYVLAGARGKKQQSEAAGKFTVSDFKGHDLRRTAATFMTRGGITREIVGKILNHVEPGVTKVYDRASYDTEKKAALAWWDRKLTAILEKQDGSNVLPFAKA
jgi:integrase